MHAFDANTVHNKEEAISKTESEASTSFITAQGSPKVGQKFPVGTRIENAFQVDGISQTFGGSIAVFEYFEDEHGAKAWGYLIYYDDGDREHMLEADVAKNLVVVRSHKRAAKSQGKQQKFKRMKHASVLGDAARSVEKEEKTSELVPSIAATATGLETFESIAVPGQSYHKVAEKPQLIVQTKTTSSSPGRRENLWSRAVTKKTPREEISHRVSRQQYAKLDRSSRENTTLSPVTKRSKASNSSVNKKEAPSKRLAIFDSESDSSEDDPLHLLVRKPVQTGVKKRITEDDMQHEMGELVDDDESSTADPVRTPTLHDPSHESPNSSQKFPKGTIVSRMFFDLSDNKREKSYGGKVVDYVYVDEEKDWLYFVQYDDGDTDFMDEWEVARFSAVV